MRLTHGRHPDPTPQPAWEPTPDDLSHVRSSIDALRDRVRVALHRAADRRRLADNAGAAGQEGFELALRAAAEAHAATARTLEEALADLERWWATVQHQRRIGARAVLSLRAASESLGVPASGWRDAG